MMKKHILIFSVLLLAALVVLLSGIAPAQAETTASQGGNYVLTAQTADNSNALTGGEYRMSPSIALSDTSGCCCKANMPCIIR
jgi:hypothetical protein